MENSELCATGRNPLPRNDSANSGWRAARESEGKRFTADTERQKNMKFSRNRYKILSY
jgi:hypothetical protein